MERVFSVEEISDPFWAPPPAPTVGGGGGQGSEMNRSSSEWCFQKFLEEAVLDGPAGDAGPSPGPAANARRGGGGGQEGQEVVEIKAASAAVDPVEYNAMLKQKLEKDLAAVAMWRASGAMPPESSAAGSASPNSDALHKGSQNDIRGIYPGNGGVPVQNKLGGGPTAGPGQQFVQNVDALVKQAASSSSRDPSDDDDMEGEAETVGNADPAEEKLSRRKQSNRESARRSRSRKAAHVNDLEAQVAQLRAENSSLLRRLADVNQRYNDSAVDNRVLKADVETLRAKVKMAEDQVKRVTGMNPLLPSTSDISSLSMAFNSSPSDATFDAAVPIQDDPNNYFATTNDVGTNSTYMPEIASSAQVEHVVNGALDAGKMGRPASMLRVASLEHLQKRICGGSTSSGSASWDSHSSDQKVSVDKQ